MAIFAPETEELLREGHVTVRGEFVWGSNYTFLAQIEYQGQTLSGVYKPTRGERPLWDFPQASLARREVAAYLVSEALGWKLVPPTVFRLNAPLGPGSLQLYIDHDPEYHYFTFNKQDVQRLRATALFDVLINNADRKGSHVLIGPDKHLWCIDHGLCFHIEDKLRTVIWDFTGEAITPSYCDDLNHLNQKLVYTNDKVSDLIRSLQDFISPAEISALADRAKNLVSTGHFPAPNPYRRHFPWPQI